MSTEGRQVYSLAWGLIALVALIIAGLCYAVAHANVTTFTLQPKPPAAKPTTFHDAARQPESDRLSSLTSTAPRFARVVDFSCRFPRGVTRGFAHDNPAAPAVGAAGKALYHPMKNAAAGPARVTPIQDKRSTSPAMAVSAGCTRTL